jgi:hypothetical protein
MTPLTQTTPNPAATARRRARKRRSFDAVVASYIRELASGGESAPRPTAVRVPQGC